MTAYYKIPMKFRFSTFLRNPSGMPVQILLALLLTACGGTTSQVSQSNPILGSVGSVREEFDPQTLDDDDFLLQPTSGRTIFEIPDPVVTQPTRPTARAARGYRVQVAAVLDRVRAHSIKSRSEQLLKQRVYVNYDERTRLYKLHVGNCRTATEAETLRRDIKTKGYPEAFIVRSAIETAPSPYRISTRVGYRVQIFSASNRGSAENASKDARTALERDDIYVVFEPPYFKVHVGDFTTKEDADKFVETARKRGYDTPFPVRTEIRDNR